MRLFVTRVFKCVHEKNKKLSTREVFLGGCESTSCIRALKYELKKECKLCKTVFFKNRIMYFFTIQLN